MTDNTARADDEGLSLLDALQVMAQDLRLLVFGPLLIGLCALGVAYLISPVFTASTKFLVPQQQQSTAAAMLQNLGSFGGLPSAANFLRNPADQYVAFLRSRTLQDILMDRFKLMERYEQDTRLEARRVLVAVSTISHAKDGLITVEVDDKDPAFAAKLANAYVEELANMLGRLAVTEPQQRRAFFEKQLIATKGSLTKAEMALKASGVNSSALKSSPQAAVETLAKLQAGIRAQEIKLASMRAYLSDSAPEFKQGQMELAELRRQLAQSEKEDTPATATNSDYIAKLREVKYQEALTELVSKQYEIARLDESREGPGIQVVDVAVPPEHKSKPKKAQIAVIATLASGLVLLIFVFARHAVRTSRINPSTDQQFGRLGSTIRRAWLRT